MPDPPEYDDSTRYLGTLCKRRHDWGGTGKSLRQRSNRTCVECRKLAAKTDRARAKKRAADRRYWHPNWEKIRRRHKVAWWRNRSKRLEQKRRDYEANKERILADQRRYCERNEEVIKARQKRYREANEERIKTRDRAYYLANKEEIKTRIAAYKRSNPDSVRASQDRRRGRKQATGGSYSAEEVANMYESQGGLCAYCELPLNGKYHVDHMTPLCLGGTNSWENLAVVCPFCNQSKHTKTVEEFFETRRPDKRQ
ncbi:MAG: HNH endonuclease [Rubrobacteraceae bacterium]